jgi:type II secretion system protein G
MKLFAPSLRAFTLIELLIVVAIIAILAAIAVPNFLEAQTRSKVSRVKADMRSLATAIESYRIDNNAYAWPANDAGERQVAPPYTEVFETMLTPDLTTPIAYMTALPRDVFNINKGNGEAQFFHYGTKPYLAFVESGDVSEFDDYTTELVGSNSAIQYFMLSHGPDKDHDSPDLSENPLGAALYDPTNGTVSSGDVVYWGPGFGFRP